jgi:crossover junction endodeoxyribonuclease RusA
MSEPLEYRVWLPWGPSANNLFSQAPMRSRRSGQMVVRRFPQKAYVRWRKQAVILLLAAKIPRFTEPVVIKLELTPPDSRRRDADNYAKPVLDALVDARILTDDSNRQVKAVIPYWENPSASSGVVVTIRLAKNVRREPLDARERKMLASVKDYRLVRPGYSSNAMRALVEKGYVRTLPGLPGLSDGEVPQGYAPID